ncbi:213_t:CDS:2, partial [Gigaspora margarita]
DVIEYFIKIKSSDEEKRLKEKSQEFKAISNPWENLFLNSKLKNNRSYEEYDNYKSSDSFIDDREIDDIYSDEITDDDNL